jgi:hypothetical protein
MTILRISAFIFEKASSTVRQGRRGQSIGVTRRLSDLGTRFIDCYRIPTPPTFTSRAQRASKGTIAPNFKYYIG